MKHSVAGGQIVGLTAGFTPYHHARWEAFSQATTDPCLIMELTNKDAFSVMEFSDTTKSTYNRITLFDRQLESDLSTSEICKRVGQQLDSVRPACVCLNGYATPVALKALDWCVAHKIPAIMMSESTAWDEPRKWWKEWFKARVVLLCSSALVGASPHGDYLAAIGFPRERIFLGYDAVDNDYFSQGASKVRNDAFEIRKRENLPGKYFLASARFVSKKNLPSLLQAYAHYRQLCLSRNSIFWDMVILGDGEGRQELLALRLKLGLVENVHLLGAKPYEDLPTYYALASAFIHASTTEQWGLVVNEAMASGLPVVVSNRCGCARALVQEGVNGLTFDPYATEDIAEKMFQLSRLDDQLSAFGHASQKIIAEWSPQRFAKGLSQAIETALSNPLPRSNWLHRVLLWILIHR